MLGYNPFSIIPQPDFARIDLLRRLLHKIEQGSVSERLIPEIPFGVCFGPNRSWERVTDGAALMSHPPGDRREFESARIDVNDDPLTRRSHFCKNFRNSECMAGRSSLAFPSSECSCFAWKSWHVTHVFPALADTWSLNPFSPWQEMQVRIRGNRLSEARVEVAAA